MAKTNTLSKEDADKAAKALEVLFASEYISKKELYKANFMRGIFFSMGTIVGATVLVVVVLWFLSLFDSVPFIGPIVDSVKSSIESSQN